MLGCRAVELRALRVVGRRALEFGALGYFRLVALEFKVLVVQSFGVLGFGFEGFGCWSGSSRTEDANTIPSKGYRGVEGF